MGRVRAAWSELAAILRSLPLPVRGLVIGGVSAGLLGALAGLIIGLGAYPPTAWFAVLELGIPAGFAGVVLGLAVGTVALAIGHLRGSAARS